MKPAFDKAALWIASNGSAALKALLSYHTQVWEASEAMSCVRTRRRGELLWLAYSEGCEDMANLTPESLTEAELDMVYKGSKSASETLAEIALNKGIR